MRPTVDLLHNPVSCHWFSMLHYYAVDGTPNPLAKCVEIPTDVPNVVRFSDGVETFDIELGAKL